MIWVILLFLIILPFAITGWLFAPWVPISNSELPRLKKLLKLKPEDVFYELGCGDGRVVEYIQKTFGCESIGVELNPFLYLLCLRRKGKYIFGDLFKQDVSRANYVYLFGLPRALNFKVKNKLAKELPKGATVISYGFQIEGWKPTKINKLPGKLPIFLYKM